MILAKIINKLSQLLIRQGSPCILIKLITVESFSQTSKAESVRLNAYFQMANTYHEPFWYLKVIILLKKCLINTYGLIFQHLGFKTCPVFVRSTKRGKTNRNQQINHLRFFKKMNFLINLTVNFSKTRLIIQK